MNSVDDIVGHFQRFYAVKLNDTQIRHYKRSLAALDEDLLIKAVNTWCDKNARLMPSVEDLRKLVWEHREAALNSAKRTAPVFQELKRSEKTPHAKRAIALLLGYDGDRQKYLAAMRRMDIDFPGFGWRRQADELEETWKKAKRARSPGGVEETIGDTRKGCGAGGRRRGHETERRLFR